MTNAEFVELLEASNIMVSVVSERGVSIPFHNGQSVAIRFFKEDDADKVDLAIITPAKDE